MKLRRKYISPFIFLLFVAVGISGLLMFFHVFDGYTEVLHELFGVAFVVFAILHTIVNWKSVKCYFGKKVFPPAVIVLIALSITFIVAERASPPFHVMIVERIVKAPISDSFKMMGIDYSHAAKILEERGIEIGDAKTLGEIGTINDVSPKKIIELIIEEH